MMVRYLNYVALDSQEALVPLVVVDCWLVRSPPVEVDHGAAFAWTSLDLIIRLQPPVSKIITPCVDI
jgi:hypothetical protein